jgi:hypothetical protein
MGPELENLTSPRKENDMQVWSSVYDSYLACPTCEQEAGQPCLNRQRMYPSHMKSVHPNRPTVNGAGTRSSYKDPVKFGHRYPLGEPQP